MPEALLTAVDGQGRLLHRAGSPAIHFFDVAFLARVTQGSSRLPYHLARKKVPHIDEKGQPVTPEKENALKFEMFVFDALPLAERWLVMEAARSEEFAPVKNAEGVDSPATAKQALSELAGQWLEAAGTVVPRNEQGAVTVPLEIAPGFALDAEEFKQKVAPGRNITGPAYWE